MINDTNSKEIAGKECLNASAVQLGIAFPVNQFVWATSISTKVVSAHKTSIPEQAPKAKPVSRGVMPYRWIRGKL